MNDYQKILNPYFYSKSKILTTNQEIHEVQNVLLYCCKNGLQKYVLFKISLLTMLPIQEILKLPKNSVYDMNDEVKSNIIINNQSLNSIKTVFKKYMWWLHIENTVSKWLFPSLDRREDSHLSINTYRGIMFTLKNKISQKIGQHTMRKTGAYVNYLKYRDVNNLLQILNEFKYPSEVLHYIGYNDNEVEEELIKNKIFSDNNYVLEKWQPVPIIDCEMKYQISNLGRIRDSHYRTKKPQVNGKGYLFYNFFYKGKHHPICIHRLVAKAFIPNPNRLPVVNHKDENPLNARVYNLEWCTYQYNSNYGTSIKRSMETKIKNNNLYKNLENPIVLISEDVEEFFNSYEEAANFVLDNPIKVATNRTKNKQQIRETIARCYKGKQNSCYGYKVKVISE